MIRRMGESMSDSEFYNDIYRELSEMIGEATVKKIWNRYRGLNISFPQRLYSRKFTREYIRKNLDRVHPKEMAEELNLTERRVRQIIKELREEKIRGKMKK